MSDDGQLSRLWAYQEAHAADYMRTFRIDALDADRRAVVGQQFRHGVFDGVFGHQPSNISGVERMPIAPAIGPA